MARLFSIILLFLTSLLSANALAVQKSEGSVTASFSLPDRILTSSDSATSVVSLSHSLSQSQTFQLRASLSGATTAIFGSCTFSVVNSSCGLAETESDGNSVSATITVQPGVIATIPISFVAGQAQNPLDSIRGRLSITFGSESIVLNTPRWTTALLASTNFTRDSNLFISDLCDWSSFQGTISVLDDALLERVNAGVAVNATVNSASALSAVLRALSELVNPGSLNRQLSELLLVLAAHLSDIVMLPLSEISVLRQLIVLVNESGQASIEKVQDSLITSSLQATCGDGFCDREFESCVSCLQDCGSCHVNHIYGALKATSFSNSLIGSWDQDVLTGNAAIRAHPDRIVDTRTSLEIEVLEKEGFGIRQAFNLFPNMHLPTDKMPERECFSGMTFAYKHDGGLQNLKFEANLSSVFIAQDPTRRFVARFYNASSSSWSLLAEQEYNSSTMIMTLISPISQQVAIYVEDNRVVEDATTSQLDSITGSVGNSSNLQDSFSTKILEALDTLLDDIANSLEPGETKLISSESLAVQAQNLDSSALSGSSARIGNASFPVVTLPDDFGSLFEGLGSVTMMMTVFKDKENKSEPDDGSQVAASILDFTLKGPDGNLAVSNLSKPIDITLVINAEAPDYQKVCRFWNASKYKANCTATGADPESCFGDWDTSGVVKVEELSTGNLIVCRTTHLSTFSVGIDFTISPPKVSADNFNPENAMYIYILYGSFYTFCALMFLYAYFERRAYDKRQGLIEAGLLWEEDLGPKPKTDGELDLIYAEKGFFLGWIARFMHGIKSKHQWVSLFWPSGKQVFPKRAIKVTAFMAATSMAFGMMSMFAYTESQNKGENTNTFQLTIAGDTVYMPLEGLYAFIITFPFFIALSINLAKYSAHIDLLRKVAPERYRNHAAMNNLKPSVKGGFMGEKLAAQGNLRNSVSFDERHFEMESNPVHVRSLSDADGDEDNSGSLDVTIEETSAEDQTHQNLMVDDVFENFTPEQALVRGFADEFDSVMKAPEYTALEMNLKNSEATGEKPYTEEEITKLDKDMKRYRRQAFGIAGFLLIGGLILCLTFMGSMTTETQIRFMKGVGEFLIISAIITAPAVLLVLTGRRQWYVTSMKRKYSEEEWKQHCAGVAAAATAMVMTRAMFYREIGRVLRENFDIYII